MIIISCSHGRHIGPLIAKNLKSGHSFLFTEKFPDDELHLRLDCRVKGKKAVFVQSFYKNISDCILEAVLAARTAKELGAVKTILVAPYFPYLRQDKRFRKGECVSQFIIAGLVGKYFDEVLVFDPHLHRTKKLDEIFKVKSKKLTANSMIANYIKIKVKNPVLIGPDEESYKWARHVAEMIGAPSRIMKKKRHSSYHVEVSLNKKIGLRNKTVVIVDDIISTGHTIIEASKLLRKIGAAKILCICVHGIFVADALEKLKKEKIEVVSCNTIPNSKVKIDVSGIVAENLR